MNIELNKRSTYLSQEQLARLLSITHLEEYDAGQSLDYFSVIRYMTNSRQLRYAMVSTEALEQVTGATKLKEKSTNV